MNNMNNNDGVLLPTIKPFPVGANSARNAGIAINTANTSKQMALLNSAQGGSKKKRGGASTITVPIFQVLYPENGAGNQTVNGNVTGTTKLGATSFNNSVYDSCVGQGASCTQEMAKQSGGVKQSGGLKWGCYSGGKKSKKRSKKSRKSKKSKKSKKSRSRKSRKVNK